MPLPSHTPAPTASDVARAIVHLLDAARCAAENDNAGLAWRVEDAAPYRCDDRRATELRTRVARLAAPRVVAEVSRAWWSVYEDRKPSCVVVSAAHPYSTAVRRRQNTLRELARAAGFETFSR